MKVDKKKITINIKKKATVKVSKKKITITGKKSGKTKLTVTVKGMIKCVIPVTVRKAGNTVRKDIAASAPKDTGAYAKSWSVKKTKETSNSLELTVHSKNRYQLAHLLEHGHAKRGGG